CVTPARSTWTGEPLPKRASPSSRTAATVRASSVPLTRKLPSPRASRWAPFTAVLMIDREPGCAARPSARLRLRRRGRLLHRTARHLRLEPRDDGFETLLLNLRAEIGAERLHVGHTRDLHVVGLPALRRLAQRIIHRHAR